jgi:uncharacterized protein DUF397
MINDAPVFWQRVKFRKSSFSGSNGGACVEVAQAPTMFGIRDSKHADGPILALPAGQARAFLAAVKRQHP